MRFKVLSLVSLLFATAMFAQNIQVVKGWQLLGATENIDAIKFDGKCMDFIWKYDNGWKLHIANGKSYDTPSSVISFNTINKGEGFWIKGNSNCNIDTNNTNDSTTQDTKALLAGKTFYVVHISSTEHFMDKVTFNKDVTQVTGIGLRNDDSDTEQDTIQLISDKIIWSSDSSYSIVQGQEAKYILISDYNADGSSDGTSYLFSSKSDAEAYYNSIYDTSFLSNMLTNKIFYTVSIKTIENLTMKFDNDKVTIGGNEDFTQPVSYATKGNELDISGAKFIYNSKNSDYLEFEFTCTPSSFKDDTNWFESTYDTNVSSFNNSATKLKDWFLVHGLWQTTITTDGKVNKYDTIPYDGYWYIKDNIFYFAYPDSDGNPHLDIKAYKVENNRLLFQTDASISETVRFYYDKSLRDAYLKSKM